MGALEPIYAKGLPSPELRYFDPGFYDGVELPDPDPEILEAVETQLYVVAVNHALRNVASVDYCDNFLNSYLEDLEEGLFHSDFQKANHAKNALKDFSRIAPGTVFESISCFVRLQLISLIIKRLHQFFLEVDLDSSLEFSLHYYIKIKVVMTLYVRQFPERKVGPNDVVESIDHMDSDDSGFVSSFARTLLASNDMQNLSEVEVSKFFDYLSQFEQLFERAPC